MNPKAQAVLAGRRRRIQRVRARVAAITVATFLAFFAGIYVQMATGHDPVLGAKQVASTSTSTSTKSTSTQSSSSDDEDTTAAQPAAVTTSQS